MNVISLSTDSMPAAVRAESWREFISRTIHSVSVERLSDTDFAAKIDARQYDGIRCASFWSKPHDVLGKKESFANAGASGYLVSWQIEGTAEITQAGRRILARSGDLTVIDGRESMRVRFNKDVRRIVANLPAATVEKALPVLQRVRSLPLSPEQPYAAMFHTYLTELATGQHELQADDVELLIENVCNLLKITARGQNIGMTPREFQRDAIIQFIRRNATKSDLSLDDVAAQLKTSGRSIQKILQESRSSFSSVLLAERLTAARAQLICSREKISRIAYSCGFNDISNFNHAFRKQYGTTPSGFRMAHLGDQPAD
ncbi:HTH araC/xylS-type domain-containing protein [Bordetella tumbae]|uniref:helix-turn-helix domain-containing protein n=1 Tax=Bordetella tumbae TaxID=1649139 RepID=UPI0039F014C7